MPVGREPRAIAVDRNGVWVANAGDGTVMRIDPRSRQVTDDRSTSRAAPPRWPWSTGRCGPPRSRPPPRTAAAPCASRIADLATARPRSDPADLGPAASLVYDGLVAYRRAGGSAGTALVADLATRRARAKPRRPDVPLQAAPEPPLLQRSARHARGRPRVARAPARLRRSGVLRRARRHSGGGAVHGPPPSRARPLRTLRSLGRGRDRRGGAGRSPST